MQVTINTVSHEGILEDQGRDPVAFFGRHGVAVANVLADAIDIAANADHRPGDGPHVVTGPIAVRGARPGDWLAVRVDALARRADYGVVSTGTAGACCPADSRPGEAPVTSVFCRVDDRHGYLPLRPAAADLGADDRPGVRFPLAPFLGIMGVTPRGAVRRGSIAPGEFGGNPLTATLTLGLVEAAAGKPRFGEVAGPVVTTPQYLVPTGLDADLDIAVERCAANAVELLRASFGMDPALGYAYLSAAADFDISQVVNLVKGVHARIRRADFPAREAGHGDIEPYASARGAGALPGPGARRRARRVLALRRGAARQRPGRP